jgi:hypothetical protein
MTEPNLDDVNHEDLRRDATDAELEAVLRHPRYWSNVVRFSAGDVVCWGRDKTRRNCERGAEINACELASELCWDEDDWRTRQHLREARFLIWPPLDGPGG